MIWHGFANAQNYNQDCMICVLQSRTISVILVQKVRDNKTLFLWTSKFKHKATCKSTLQLEKPRNFVSKCKVYHGRGDDFLKFSHKKKIQAHRAEKKSYTVNLLW